MSQDMASSPRDKRLAAATDVCVKCGLCLPQCPTYLKTSDENESPRGRLSLIQGWAQGALDLTPKLKGHIDQCLLCRSCEAACPANVSYGKIVDDFRAHIHDYALDSSDNHRRINDTVLGFLKGGQPRLVQSGLGHLARTSAGKSIAKRFGLEAMTQGLPDLQPGIRHISEGSYPALTKEPQGRAQLFLGCTSTLLDAETLDSAVALLNILGITVDVPENQGCCGALDLHAGVSAEAERLKTANEKAFRSDSSTAVISCASGCGATLQDYDNEKGSIGSRHIDISTYLDTLPWPEDVAIAPSNASILVHTPCSLRNVQKVPEPPLRLIKKIKGLTIRSIPANIRCCGASGSFMLNHPEEARKYRKDVLDQAIESVPTVLISSNPGCAAHLRAGLKELGLEIEVMHPVTLLWRQVRAARNSPL